MFKLVHIPRSASQPMGATSELNPWVRSWMTTLTTSHAFEVLTLTLKFFNKKLRSGFRAQGHSSFLKFGVFSALRFLKSFLYLEKSKHVVS